MIENVHGQEDSAELPNQVHRDPSKGSELFHKAGNQELSDRITYAENDHVPGNTRASAKAS